MGQPAPEEAALAAAEITALLGEGPIEPPPAEPPPEAAEEAEASLSPEELAALFAPAVSGPEVEPPPDLGASDLDLVFEEPVELAPEDPPAPLELSRALYSSPWVSQITRKLRDLNRASLGPADRQLIAALLRAVTNDGLDLPVMPKVVLDIQRVLDAPDYHLDEVFAAIEREPTVSTKIVGISSSAYYRSTTSVRGLRGALFRIGMAETRNVVLAIVSQSRLFRVPSFERESSALYLAALASASAARELARRVGLDRDEAFLAGMTHDIGAVLVLSAVAKAARAGASDGAAPRPTPELLDAVRSAVHAELGALIAETWSFSGVLVEAFARHHHPEDAAPEARRLAELLCLADAIAVELLRADDAPSVLADHPLLATLGLEGRTTELVEAARVGFESIAGDDLRRGRPVTRAAPQR